MKKIAILGSTGSIGTQALSVIDQYPDLLEPYALTTYGNTDLLMKQIKKYMPKVVGIIDKEKGEKIRTAIPSNIKVILGIECLTEICALSEIDIVLVAVVGISGLPAVMESIKNDKIIALANKEALVTGGSIIKQFLKHSKSILLPVDSEHSAIFQCLQGVNHNSISKLILTASGGPFRNYSPQQLENVTLHDALKHPNWSMGPKITIDCATLMNKGFELIEAHWLFDIKPECISILIHPQSIIHSMVEFHDQSVLAQLGMPNMQIPIAYALFYPERKPLHLPPLNLADIGVLNFERPRTDLFPCLQYANYALQKGGIMPTVLNASNEVAVSLFLNERIKFIDIPIIIENVLMKTQNIQSPSLYDIYQMDQTIKNEILKDYERQK